MSVIRVCRVQNINRIKADVKIAAVQTMKRPNETVFVCPELAPDDTMLAAKAQLREQGAWNRETFQERYVPMYLDRLCTAEARRTLNWIYKLVKSGKTVAIGCYCADEENCHRSILAGLFQALDLEVTGVKADYSDYYAQRQAVYGRFKAREKAAA